MYHMAGHRAWWYGYFIKITQGRKHKGTKSGSHENGQRMRLCVVAGGPAVHELRGLTGPPRELSPPPGCSPPALCIF